MDARIQHPAMTVPGAFDALTKLGASVKASGLDQATLELVNLRASQLNSCSVCVEGHASELKKAGASDERIWAVSAWRESPHFTAAERAALSLTEATTRLSDRADPVPDQVWDEAANHYEEAQLAALVMNIAVINLWNRLNAATHQVAGSLPT